jgi:hypothetical protein
MSHHDPSVFPVVRRIVVQRNPMLSVVTSRRRTYDVVHAGDEWLVALLAKRFEVSYALFGQFAVELPLLLFAVLR